MTEDDLRTFIREVTRRNELVARDLIRSHARHTESMVARLEEQRLAFVDMRTEMSEQRKQIQANTQAVLSVLDRLS